MGEIDLKHYSESMECCNPCEGQLSCKGEDYKFKHPLMVLGIYSEDILACARCVFMRLLISALLTAVKEWKQMKGPGLVR